MITVRMMKPNDNDNKGNNDDDNNSANSTTNFSLALILVYSIRFFFSTLLQETLNE